MLPPICETASYNAALPPRPSAQPKFQNCKVKESSSYGDDADPTFETDSDSQMDYAKSYAALQLRKPQSDKGLQDIADSPGSNDSDSSFVFNMSASQEPLYGDPGEEDSSYR